jgi:hypothetical protein
LFLANCHLPGNRYLIGGIIGAALDQKPLAPPQIDPFDAQCLAPGMPMAVTEPQEKPLGLDLGTGPQQVAQETGPQIDRRFEELVCRGEVRLVTHSGQQLQQGQLGRAKRNLLDE